ncbi:Noc2-domain-containing protein [Neolentinus lepideus HHB14362 ss-1]|uniref:Noc2-domain-containing protein n=1 Tax=Neolentinus lepideus HHB14362 ss-1 TaxID=1314782 RepID=A0A165SCH3_9AGAM|nr:Noc2-domain-containing protein [Neolentinus lepideus HHB14362 ss-1]
MGRKAPKSARKFAASGQLKKTIDARRKHQQIKKKIQGKKSRQDVKGKQREMLHASESEDDNEVEDGSKASRSKATSVNDILNAKFMDESLDEEDGNSLEGGSGSEPEDEDGDEDSFEDDDSDFGAVDDLEDEGDAHVLELQKLAEKDPEFYKYLQENDRELLEFRADDGMDDVDEEDAIMGDETDEKAPSLTLTELAKWQKALLDHRSLKALRKLLIAFRAASHMNEDVPVAWSIDSSSVYSKLITTALRYTPVVLQHHTPYKELQNGRFKPPTQNAKQKALQKLILSYFHNAIHLITQLTEQDMVRLAVAETAKIVPYIISSRKAVKLYLKTCLDLWSSAEDSTRITAFLAIRRLSTASDESILDMVLKGTYLTLVRSSKSTSAHTLPSINLMKNSASEIYCLPFAQGAAYQHAFGYIRQLAIHLRNSMKVKTKEGYKLVYNWQYVHSIDFWCIVLARACDTDARLENGEGESELKPLIYPLVQVTLGAMKLISASRSYPFHLQLVRSLLHLIRHTGIYIPLSPYLVSIINTALSPSHSKKASTLRPLDMETNIRAPQQYLKTRVYAEGLTEEATYLLTEWFAMRPVVSSIALPEIAFAVVTALRKSLKASKTAGSRGPSGKEISVIKGLIERVEENVKWTEQKRKDVTFAPGKMAEVEAWESNVKVDQTPLAKFVKIQRKTRENRRKLVEKARVGEDEILEE